VKWFRRKPKNYHVFRGLIYPGKDVDVWFGSSVTLYGPGGVTILVHLNGVIEFREPMTLDQLSDWAVSTAIEENMR
jgi:hypothetical protein